MAILIMAGWWVLCLIVKMAGVVVVAAEKEKLMSATACPGVDVDVFWVCIMDSGGVGGPSRGSLIYRAVSIEGDDLMDGSSTAR